SACQGLTIVPLFLILGYILFRGAPAVDRALFLERPAAAPFKDGYAGGLGHAMLGSLIMGSLAALFAVPVWIMAAVFPPAGPAPPCPRRRPGSGRSFGGGYRRLSSASPPARWSCPRRGPMPLAAFLPGPGSSPSG